MRTAADKRIIKAFLSNLPDAAGQNLGKKVAEDFSLAAIQKLLKNLGNPELTFPSVHIAGSNGKGSVVAFCAAALQEAGYQVGTFTSPHLGGYPDGIRINGDVISEEDHFRLASQMQPWAEQITTLSAFEFYTGLAFEYFRREAVDIAVIEAGLGGRLDATNVVVPRVAVITPIDLEHTSILGDSLEEIAAHKAGIIKPGVPVVMAPQRAKARQVLRARAKAQAAQVIEVGKDVRWEPLDLSRELQTFRVSGAGQDQTDLNIRMLGPHQQANATVAFSALQVLDKSGMDVGEEAIRRGFARANWPGRFEIIESSPAIVLDAAHTPAAAEALAASLGVHFSQAKAILVVGISQDKDVAAWLAPLKDYVRQVIATQSAHSRAMQAADLAELVAQSGLTVQAEADLERALAAARQLCTAGDIVLVAGSVFLVEQAAGILENENYSA